MVKPKKIAYTGRSPGRRKEVLSDLVRVSKDMKFILDFKLQNEKLLNFLLTHNNETSYERAQISLLKLQIKDINEYLSTK